LKRQIEKLGGLCLKWVSPSFTGVPDRLCLLPGGRIVFTEVKAKNGKLSQRQHEVLNKLNQLQFDTAVIYSTEDVDELTKAYTAPQGPDQDTDAYWTDPTVVRTTSLL
jgi:hypothetical protein